MILFSTVGLKLLICEIIGREAIGKGNGFGKTMENRIRRSNRFDRGLQT